jgi:hypothetical protein
LCSALILILLSNIPCSVCAVVVRHASSYQLSKVTCFFHKGTLVVMLPALFLQADSQLARCCHHLKFQHCLLLVCCLCCCAADTFLFVVLQADSQLAQGARLGRYTSSDRKKGEEGPLLKICRDTTKLSAEQIKGLSSQVIKSILFNCNPRLGPPQQPAAAAPAVAEVPAAAAAEPAAVAGDAAAAAADGDAAMEVAPEEPTVPGAAAAAAVPEVPGEAAAAAAQPEAAAEQGAGAGAAGGSNAQPMEM